MLAARDHRRSRTLAALALDAMAAGVLAALGISELLSVGDDIFYRSADSLGITLILLQTVPLLLRRRFALPVTATVAGAATISMWMGYPGTNALLAVPLALYAVGASRLRRDTIVATVLVIALLLPPLIATQSGSASSAIVAVVVFAVGAFAGGGVRVRRLYAEALEQQAAQAEHEREMEARQAVILERNRIARELHDAIGHTVNVMVMQAGAGRMAAEVDTTKSVQALAAIEEIGRSTLGDIDRLLGLLDDDSDEDQASGATRAPAPSISELSELVARLRDAGLDAHLEVSGDLAAVPSPVGTATFRIVQEALTNALKYAGEAEVCARVGIGSEDVRIEVADDGPGTSEHTATRRAGGRGLIGMAERARSLGGELHAGPGTSGGFAVTARLPLTRDLVTSQRSEHPGVHRS